jgi:hypothetical protein
VVDRGGLENRWVLTDPGGSNPSPSASSPSARPVAEGLSQGVKPTSFHSGAVA